MKSHFYTAYLDAHWEHGFNRVWQECRHSKEQDQPPVESPADQAGPMKVALVLSGGLGDRSFMTHPMRALSG